MTRTSPAKLRIAMLAPVNWPVPPDGYGPWEQVASNLTESLVALGHDITLFAAAGSKTSAHLVETVPYPLSMWPQDEVNSPRRFDRQKGLLVGPPQFDQLELQHIAICMEAARSGQFDIVQSHLHVHALVFSNLIDCPLVSSLHGAAWVEAAHPTFDRYRDKPFVSLSNAERTLKPDLNYVGTVYNGIPLDDFPLCRDKDDYLLFAGRLSPEKGAAEAVEIARLAGRPLRMAGMVEAQYQEYFDTRVKPYIDGKNVSYLGLLSQREVAQQYRRAAAVLFPISWCEPCSMVGIEAQASGTAIIGTHFGYLPELVCEGKTGFLVDTVEAAAEAVGKLDRIDPSACRDNIERRFSLPVMAAGYQDIYYKLLEGDL